MINLEPLTLQVDLGPHLHEIIKNAVTKAFADEIGADAYAPDAYSGVEIVNHLLPQAWPQKKVGNDHGA